MYNPEHLPQFINFVFPNYACAASFNNNNNNNNNLHFLPCITKEDIGIEQQLYEIVKGKNFALNCLS